jgi:hypothetical protein
MPQQLLKLTCPTLCRQAESSWKTFSKGVHATPVAKAYMSQYIVWLKGTSIRFKKCGCHNSCKSLLVPLCVIWLKGTGKRFQYMPLAESVYATRVAKSLLFALCVVLLKVYMPQELQKSLLVTLCVVWLKVAVAKVLNSVNATRVAEKLTCRTVCRLAKRNCGKSCQKSVHAQELQKAYLSHCVSSG